MKLTTLPGLKKNFYKANWVLKNGKELLWNGGGLKGG
jgi:hypothetical protein